MHDSPNRAIVAMLRSTSLLDRHPCSAVPELLAPHADMRLLCNRLSFASVECRTVAAEDNELRQHLIRADGVELATEVFGDPRQFRHEQPAQPNGERT